MNLKRINIPRAFIVYIYDSVSTMASRVITQQQHPLINMLCIPWEPHIFPQIMIYSIVDITPPLIIQRPTFLKSTYFFF